MPIVRQDATKLSLDMGASTGQHLWVAKGCTLQDSGYEKLPEWAELRTQGVTSGHFPRGAHCWRGGYTGRIYAATDDKFWEVIDSSITDVTGTTPTNATNGVKFASYGEWCFAANGVDEIQAIRVPSATGGTTNFGDMNYTSGGAHISPKYICSHKNHLVAANLTFLESYGEIASFTTPAGAAFTSLNQPNGDSIQVYGDAADAGKITVYGTYTGGGDTMTAEEITIVGGGGAVTSSRSNWEKILGMNSNFDPVLITARKTTGGLVFASFTTSVGVGIEAVTAGQTSGGDQLLDIVASDTTTRVIGIIGTSELGAGLWDSQVLTGATTVQSNSRFRTFTHILTGNLEASRTVTVSAHAYAVNQEDPYLVWWSGTDDPEGYGTETYAPQIVGSSNQPLLDGVGKITGVVDGGDCFFVFKEGCIYRFDGPPFQPTVISYSVGMAAGLIPYRQGDRIYFWANSGLNYINILDNSVTPTMGGYVQRAVVDYANANYGSVIGGFPQSRVSTVQYKNAVATESGATICGDPENSLVMVLYKNSSAAGTHGFIYHEKKDAFTQIIGHASSNSSIPYLVDYRTGGAQAPGMFAYLRSWGYKSAAVTALSKMSAIGMPGGSADDIYLRWPFLGAAPGGPVTRITRVKPIFDNPAITLNTQSLLIHCGVISINGTGKNWLTNGKMSVGQGTTSLDGWITIDGCPNAERHSVGVSFLGGVGAASPNPSVVGFVGIDVEVVAYGKKGI